MGYAFERLSKLNLVTQEQCRKIYAYLEHLDKVDKTREEYRELKKTAKSVVAQLRQDGQLGERELQKSTPNTRPITMHYSFDFAQQVHYLSMPNPPGPIFFMTSRKCAIFVVKDFPNK